jgi:hypothetical protein
MSEIQAKQIGILVGRSGHTNVVNVAVVEGAIRRGDGIVTSDPRDIQRIAGSARSRITIATI